MRKTTSVFFDDDVFIIVSDMAILGGPRRHSDMQVLLLRAVEPNCLFNCVIDSLRHFKIVPEAQFLEEGRVGQNFASLLSVSCVRSYREFVRKFRCVIVISDGKSLEIIPTKRTNTGFNHLNEVSGKSHTNAGDFYEKLQLAMHNCS